ncbi:LysR family transcriptional regulator [Komagataeibacter oboediens]|uniref:LysR family transcriptional regulator n=1 Tax=Komagataeibacter oboediens TaxID=65958 RepID=A0ABS5SMU3_9PROT|nr:LysR family transcriptional regulator [Komagataeibacter oboediens]MBL7233286.1 LysR family transcriptional regulator [Komagataeibacter oboediens]MBT0675528.1 LysR family transcriptional regulator [Komagataeibacter oboediens]MBT0679870.1 LysR family transcriptional regulator [Komagataeibacter oboediens]
MLQLTQVRCFVTVAEELHFGRAAARLNMTQPPLSRQVQLLEHALGVELLERNSRSVRLTAAGAIFLPEARRLLRNAEDAMLMARRAGRGALGQVAIGFTPASSYDFLPRLIHALRATYPDIELTLEEMITRDQLAALASHRIDLAFVRPPFDARDTRARLVRSEPMVAALPHTHPLATRAALTPADMEGQDLIMYSILGGGYFHDLVRRLLVSANIQPRLVHHLTQIHALLSMVRTGVGIALIPESASRLGIENVICRPLAFGDAILAELYMVHRTDDASPVLGSVMAIADQITATDGPGTCPA